MKKPFYSRLMRNSLAILLFVLANFQIINAQNNSKLTYHNTDKLFLYGKAFQTPQQFHRVDTALYNDLPQAVKSLLTNSAGLAIAFKTNSKTIGAKWCVTDRRAAVNMTPIAQKGLDLYIKKDGKWQFAGVGKPSKTCSEGVIVKAMDEGEKECLLFLPLYDELKSIEIGIDEGATISAIANPFKKRIVIYGSSIVHGASAGRPGMAYPAILSRKTGLYFMNLGISGNAKMEKSAAKMVSDIDADAFVLDCIPNPNPTQIKERTEDFAKIIRQKHPKAPIIFVETIIREHSYFDLAVQRVVKGQNEEVNAAFARLKASGMKDIYLIKAQNLLGDDHDGTTDGTHPNDLGFYRMSEQLAPQLTAILNQYNIK